jgi:EAL domain-containing protein (putative c-di-GMP-specific phosphodiesterase class I)
VTAAEALARWRRPDGSVLGADQFIGLAEETRLITPIGAWVFDRACTEAATWSSHNGRPLTVRVNFSAVQFEEPDLITMVRETLRTTGIDPSRVCAEITETVLLKGLEATRRCLKAMRELGMGVAIDDFGTGYASITYLSQYPVTVLKIDRAFTQDMVRDPSGRRLVSGLVALARTVGVDVTAEGVETLEQARQLRELGCPTAQGFLFSCAVPSHEFAGLCDTVFPHD